MPEPVSTLHASVTLAAGAVAVPVLSVFGIPLGLRPDELLAAFAGSLAAIALLDTVPGSSDTLRELVRTSLKRVGVALSSAVTAGYLVPPAVTFFSVPGWLELSLCFVVGAGAQRLLRVAVDKAASKAESV